MFGKKIEAWNQGMIKCPSTRACLDPGFESWSQVWIQKSGARSGSRRLDPKIWIQSHWQNVITGSFDISYTKSYPRFQGRRSKVRAGGARLEKGHLRPWYKLKKGIYSTRKPLTPLIPPNSPELGHFEILFSLQEKYDVLMGLKILKWLKECTMLVWNQFGPLFTTYRTLHSLSRCQIIFERP